MVYFVCFQFLLVLFEFQGGLFHFVVEPDVQTSQNEKDKNVWEKLMCFQSEQKSALAYGYQNLLGAISDCTPVYVFEVESLVHKYCLIE